MRKDFFAEGNYYHIYNRGVEKRNIFIDDDDCWRFLTLLFILQWQTHFPHIGRVVSTIKNLKPNFFISDIIPKRDFDKRTVELICFCLMPNHFHFILKEIHEEGKGISAFMQRLGDSYTKYFNIKYQRTGHLFGSVFQSVHIDQDEYLGYLSAYIHLNPRELRRWNGKEIDYPWSSFQDYARTNRWGEFLNQSIIADQFGDQEEYKNFVEESNAKNDLFDTLLIDAEELGKH